MTLTLQRVLLATVGGAILAGLVPAGIVLDRRLADALEARARAELALAPRVLADRSAAQGSALMMYAKDIAHAPGLAAAMAAGERDAALRIAAAAVPVPEGRAIVIGAGGDAWAGPRPAARLVERTRRGEMPVAVDAAAGDTLLHWVALAPVEASGAWIGAAGVAVPLDERAAGELAGVLRSGVVIAAAGSGRAVATTLDSATTAAVVAAHGAWGADTVMHEVSALGGRLLAVSAPLDDAGVAIFTREIARELAVLPTMRRDAALAATGALVLALALGALLAMRIARPARELAGAAAALAAGEFDAPLPRSRVREVASIAQAFAAMRRALAARLAELRELNEALADRNARLATLQTDLIQRERLAATGRLVGQLAHEIRNPVANLRNCLELVRRRVHDDEEAREFVELAIDELLRMHELAERMLDLERPRDGVRRCRPALVARDVVRLAGAGAPPEVLVITLAGDDGAEAAMSPDALKQVLLNLVQNAREAARQPPARIHITVARRGDEVEIEVRDEGPGIPPELLPRIFDPFVTTKVDVRGVGLGLFVAEGLVRAVGGRVSVANDERGGARFRLVLPSASPAAAPHPPATAAHA